MQRNFLLSLGKFPLGINNEEECEYYGKAYWYEVL
jgi:hypothetical protein